MALKTIVADVLCTAPQWAFKEYPQAWVEEADGTRRASHYTVACSVGGWPGLCLDNEEVRAHAEQFLRALVTRYRDHPAMGGYDVWNELNHNGDAGGCFCAASAVKFREWLAKKYETIHALNKAWYRYSYRDWNDIDPPRTNDPYPDSIDWVLLLYLPYPVMLGAKTAETIKTWVARGGRLISEGCLAYFGNLGRAGEHQPNYGLDELFGVKQQDVQFTPDLLEKLQLKMAAGYRVRGGVYLQSYLYKHRQGRRAVRGRTDRCRR